MKGLTDIPGIKVGHATDLEARTGCTVILCEGGAVGGVEVRGSATGASELDLLNPMHVTPSIHAVTFAGGSAFGLEAGAGVRRFLDHKGVGFDTGTARVPLAPCAILYDLAFAKPGVRPTREMGETAAAAATADAVVEGSVGAGTGATVGKLFGIRRAMKSGIGSATVWLDGPYAGVRVAALAAVNAFGDVRDPETGRLLAGARLSENGLDLADTARLMKSGARGGFQRGNTTLVVVATNARLSKIEATRLAQLAGVGMARALSPPWTAVDGDLIIALSLGAEQAGVDALGVAAAEAVAGSIVRAVKLARGMGGLPGLAG